MNSVATVERNNKTKKVRTTMSSSATAPETKNDDSTMPSTPNQGGTALPPHLIKRLGVRLPGMKHLLGLADCFSVEGYQKLYDCYEYRRVALQAVITWASQQDIALAKQQKKLSDTMSGFLNTDSNLPPRVHRDDEVNVEPHAKKQAQEDQARKAALIEGDQQLVVFEERRDLQAAEDDKKADDLLLSSPKTSLSRANRLADAQRVMEALTPPCSSPLPSHTPDKGGVPEGKKSKKSKKSKKKSKHKSKSKRKSRSRSRSKKRGQTKRKKSEKGDATKEAPPEKRPRLATKPGKVVQAPPDPPAATPPSPLPVATSLTTTTTTVSPRKRSLGYFAKLAKNIEDENIEGFPPAAMNPLMVDLVFQYEVSRRNDPDVVKFDKAKDAIAKIFLSVIAQRLARG